MKIALAVLCALACALFPLSSCIGPRTDQAVLFEPARSSWPYVRDDLQVGVADGQADGELSQESAEALLLEAVKLGAALEASDRVALRVVQWPVLRPWAERGIETKLERQEIGPGVAKSFREHVHNFDDAVQRLRGAK